MNTRQLLVLACTRSGAFLEQVITTTGYIICFKSLQMFPLENFHLWNCQVRCLWGETWLQGIGSCHDKSCRTKQQENFDFERKHLVWVVSVRWPLFPMQLALGRPRVDTRSWSRQILLVCTQCVFVNESLRKHAKGFILWSQYNLHFRRSNPAKNILGHQLYSFLFIL